MAKKNGDIIIASFLGWGVAFCYHAKQLRDRNFLDFQRISVQT
jgi:hypothetical protein